MALNWNADTDEVDFGADSSLWINGIITVIIWHYPTTVDTAYRPLLDKINAGETSGWNVTVTDTWDSGILNCYNVNRIFSGGYKWRHSVANMVVLNTWNCVAVKYPSNVANEIQIYTGDLATALNEVSYFSTNSSSGTLADDSANTLYGGNSAGGVGYRGDIAQFAVFARDMSLGEMIAHQWNMSPKNPDCKLCCHLGFNGTGTQADWSGKLNNGTVTGATVAAHVPLMPGFGFDVGWMGSFKAVTGSKVGPLALMGVGI